MSELPVPPTRVPGRGREVLGALLASRRQGPRVVFRGTISTVNPAVVLNPFVDAVHGERREARAEADPGRPARARVLQLVGVQVVHPLDRADRIAARGEALLAALRVEPGASGSARACSRSPATA